MILFIKNFWKKFVEKSILYKIAVIAIMLLYIGVLFICFYKVTVQSTSPGEINKVGKFIEFEDNKKDIKNPNIYTVSVYSKTKNSLLEYWISKLDSNTVVSKHDYEEDVITIEEDYSMSFFAKEQSIQDSLIVAYKKAKKDGYEVNLKTEYKGVRVNYILANHYNSGPESLMIGDIITNIGGTDITDFNIFKTEIMKVYNEYLTLTKNVNSEDEKEEILKKMSSIEITVIRNEKEVKLENNNIVHIINLGIVLTRLEDKDLSFYLYDYYNINYKESIPAIKINKINTIGPSGGAIQALYIYDMITKNSIIKNRYIVGTGTINSQGKVGEIGGIQQKILTANIYYADIFFVPIENKDDALKAYNDLKKPKFKIMIIKNFDEMIDKLKGE